MLAAGLSVALLLNAAPSDYSLRDLAETRQYTLGRPGQAQITPDGRFVVFLRSEARSPVMALYELEIATGRVRELLNPSALLKGGEEALSSEEKARRERQRVSLRGFASFELSPDGESVLLVLSDALYVLKRRGPTVLELPHGAGALQDPHFSPDGRSVSYVRGNDVYVMDLARKIERAVTSGGSDEVSHGVAEFVAQEEMDRHSGYWWSPDASQIAFEEADARGVEVWHVSNPARPGDAPQAQFYPRPGQKNVTVRLGLAALPREEADAPAPPVWVAWDRERFPYLATVKWSASGPLTLVVESRDQRALQVLAVDRKTGATTLLLTETSESWLDLDQDVPFWLPGGLGFLWSADRASGPQLELRNTKGVLVRVVVKPENGYVSNASYRGAGLAFDAPRKAVYFRGGPDATETHVYRASLLGRAPERVTDEPGVHAISWGPDFSAYVLRTSGLQQMPRTLVRRANVPGTIVLPSVAEEPPFLPRTEITSVTAGGRRFAAAITRPADFVAQKTYPVLVEVYGGPNHAVVAKAASRFVLSQWRADQGFIVVSLDGRGTPRHGHAWERAIRGSFGVVPLADQVAGLQALGARYRELDLARVGIAGWSFGGYLAALAVEREPNVFKAAVAGAPVAAWEDYDTHYTERYLGVPQENAAGYKESSLLTDAAQLRRPLLLIHGTTDDNVFFAHTLKLSDALFRAGRDHELLPLNGSTHMVSEPGVREELEQRIIRFFKTHLALPPLP